MKLGIETHTAKDNSKRIMVEDFDLADTAEQSVSYSKIADVLDSPNGGYVAELWLNAISEDYGPTYSERYSDNSVL